MSRQRLKPYLFIFAVVLVTASFLAGCATVDEVTIDTVSDTNHVMQIPRRINQDDWRPEPGTLMYQSQEAVLYTELGSRFYNLGEYGVAADYFERALEFDNRKSKAHYALGRMAYEDGEFVDALYHFQQIRRREQIAPYDIDYHIAAEMILEFFPFQAKITSIDPHQFTSDTPVVGINRGYEHGVREGMEFNVFRVGSAIRDVESVETIGEQRTQIARAVVVRVEPRMAHVELHDQEEGLLVQIDDLLETDYLSQVPETLPDAGTFGGGN